MENLPQDEMRLIREVIVTNKTSGKSVALRTFTDNYLEADVELIRRRVNKIQIDVRDINNVVKSQIFTIDAR